MASTPRFALVDLGTVFGISSSGACINDAGWAGGIAAVNDGTAEISTGNRAFVWTGQPGRGGMTFPVGSLRPGEDSDGRFLDRSGRISGRSGDGAYVFVGRPGGGGEMRALAGLGSLDGINDANQFVGQATIDGVLQAALYSGLPGEGGRLLGLGVLEEGLASEAVAINDAGRIAGNSPVGQGNQAFLYVGVPGQGGAMHGLGTLGQPASIAFDMNAAGDVVGIAGDTAFLYTGTPGVDGRMQDIGGFLASPSVSASLINDAGVIAGSALIPEKGQRQTCVFVDSSWIPLGSLGGPENGPVDLNDQGTVIGMAVTAGDRGLVPFVSFGFAPMVDLNGLLDDPTGAWTLTEVAAINAAGQIVGTARRKGDPPFMGHAVLLSPAR